MGAAKAGYDSADEKPTCLPAACDSRRRMRPRRSTRARAEPLPGRSAGRSVARLRPAEHFLAYGRAVPAAEGRRRRDAGGLLLLGEQLLHLRTWGNTPGCAGALRTGQAER